MSDAELAIIVEHNAHYENKRRWGEWESRRSAAQQIVDAYAVTTTPRKDWLMDPDRAFDNVGPEPVFDQAILDAATERVLAREPAPWPPAKAGAMAAKVQSYDGPLNRRGYPPQAPGLPGAPGEVHPLAMDLKRLWGRRGCNWPPGSWRKENMNKFSLASVAHMVGGFIIGAAGLLGAPVLWLCSPGSGTKKRKSTSASPPRDQASDLGEWA